MSGLQSPFLSRGLRTSHQSCSSNLLPNQTNLVRTEKLFNLRVHKWIRWEFSKHTTKLPPPSSREEPYLRAYDTKPANTHVCGLFVHGHGHFLFRFHSFSLNHSVRARTGWPHTLFWENSQVGRTKSLNSPVLPGIYNLAMTTHDDPLQLQEPTKARHVGYFMGLKKSKSF